MTIKCNERTQDNEKWNTPYEDNNVTNSSTYPNKQLSIN